MRRRAAAAKEREVTKLEDLREIDPEGHWPRIVAVIDEFQYLFVERDAVTRAALTLLEDIARRGRSQGIHLVLASQDVSGIEAFWGRPAIFEQFVLRDRAAPRPPGARRAQRGPAGAAALARRAQPRVRPAGTATRSPGSRTRAPPGLIRDEVQREIPAELVRRASPSRGCSTAAARPASPSCWSASRPGDRHAPIGQCIDLQASPADRRPARRAGPQPRRARRGRRPRGPRARHRDGRARRGLRAGRGRQSCSRRSSRRPSSRSSGCASGWTRHGHTPRIVGRDGIKSVVEELAAQVTKHLASGERPATVLVLFGADAADPVLERPGTEALRTLVHFGPRPACTCSGGGAARRGSRRC